MAKSHIAIQNSIARKAPSSLGRANKLLLVAILIMAIFEVVISNAKASNGSRMVELQEQYDTLQLQVTELELEVASYSSLTRIEEYAEENLEMEPVGENILYLPLGEDEP